jgi:hypothetical protein
MNDSNQTANDKWQIDKLTIDTVDEKAKELCQLYNNFAFFKWYCIVVDILGIERIEVIQARCSDAKNPAALFSKLASQEAKKAIGLDKYEKLRAGYGKK